MKTLIIETANAKILGELVTASRLFCQAPDVVVLGSGELQGSYGKAYRLSDTLGANLGSSLTDLIRREGYELILLSTTAIGSGLAGPLAVSLGAPILSEVTAISPDLTIERSLYGSKAVARYKLESGPLVLTIKRKYFEAAILEGTTATEELPVGPQKITLLEEIEEERTGIPLEDAEVVVTGGRGIGSGDNFSILKEIAGMLNGAVGASRGAVDEGWMPPGAQIGQTGKIVAPTVYFAVGVSGASQHLAGISNAKCVVAINKDNEANIFKRARFGIVGDYKKAVPALINALKENA
ncbi:electron transfer flavoprotein subunit alpha/FixB family protein [Geobacter grbiciae]|uniref:electron transfer flavoprotein subunit alpha/FixB family protein n=1 Tax=Geobacter grbiciae TaxID=155042 RepID=UPI001C02301B|nr:electron transfer flavoprotein subunit alpha/FixB family protein [Geobacter grbiciae]MBT1075800.1 electron transfer flavoprotein subunit alpha/FixB family protein [Geobacter grbiciae]